MQTPSPNILDFGVRIVLESIVDDVETEFDHFLPRRCKTTITHLTHEEAQKGVDALDPFKLFVEVFANGNDFLQGGFVLSQQQLKAVLRFFIFSLVAVVLHDFIVTF